MSKKTKISKEAQAELESPEAFKRRLDGTFRKYESIVLMREDLYKLQEHVDRMIASGLKYETIVILMHHHTKIPIKTIRKVLEGLKEIPERYFNEE